MSGTVIVGCKKSLSALFKDEGIVVRSLVAGMRLYLEIFCAYWDREA